MGDAIFGGILYHDCGCLNPVYRELRTLVGRIKQLYYSLLSVFVFRGFPQKHVKQNILASAVRRSIL